MNTMYPGRKLPRLQDVSDDEGERDHSSSTLLEVSRSTLLHYKKLRCVEVVSIYLYKANLSRSVGLSPGSVLQQQD